MRLFGGKVKNVHNVHVNNSSVTIVTKDGMFLHEDVKVERVEL